MRKPCREKRATKKAGAGSKKLQDEMVVEDVAGIIHEEKGPGRSPPQPQATAAVLGSAKTCKQSWINDPRPALNRLNFGQDEEDLILKLHALLGNRWSLIAGRLPGRTDNQVENYWNYHLKRKLLSMGIDPNNHRIYHSTLPRRKNQIPEISDSDDSSSCATSAVSKSHKYYYGQNKIHVTNGTGNIELSKTFDRKSSDLPDLSLELAKINSNPHAAASSTSVIGAQEKKSAAISL